MKTSMGGRINAVITIRMRVRIIYVLVVRYFFSTEARKRQGKI